MAAIHAVYPESNIYSKKANEAFSNQAIDTQKKQNTYHKQKATSQESNLTREKPPAPYKV